MRAVVFSAVAFVAVVLICATVEPTGSGVKVRAPEIGLENTYEHPFNAKAAVVELLGDPDEMLDVYVFDPAGGLIAHATNVTAPTRLVFVPRGDGVHRVVVRRSDARPYC